MFISRGSSRELIQPHHLANLSTRRGSSSRRSTSSSPSVKRSKRSLPLFSRRRSSSSQPVVTARRRSSSSCSLAAVKIDDVIEAELGARRLVLLVVCRRDCTLSSVISVARRRRCFRLGSRSRQCCLRAASTPASLFPAASAPGSQLYAATSSPALLFSSLQHRLDSDSDSGSSLRCCCVGSGSDAAPVYFAASHMPRLLSFLLALSFAVVEASPRAPLIVARLLHGSSARLGSFVRQLGPLFGSAQRLVCSAWLGGSTPRIVGSARLLVSAACRLVCSARLVGSPRRFV